MASNRYVAKSYLAESERQELARLCDQTGLSQSELIRRLIVGAKLPSPQDRAGWEDIKEILSVNADIARLGNLFKLALDEEQGASRTLKLGSIAGQIDEARAELKGLVIAIREVLQPMRTRPDDRKKGQ